MFVLKTVSWNDTWCKWALSKHQISCTIKARLHQVSTSVQSQRCDDASDTVLIQNNGVTPD